MRFSSVRGGVAAVVVVSAGALSACGASETKVTTAAAPPKPSATPVDAPSSGPIPLPEGVEVASIDPGAKACDDFFQYACGGWIKANPIPEDQPGWGRFDALGEQNEAALREILERDAARPDASEARASDLGQFYASCMDEKAVEKDGVRALAAGLSRVDAVRDAASFARAVADAHAHQSRAFFLFVSEQDAKDATQVIARLEQGGLGLPDRDYYVKDEPRMAEMRAKYQAHVERALALVGETPAQAKADAEGVLRVERALAAASMPAEERRDPRKTYNRMDQAGLRKLAPHFAWDVYLKELGFPGITAVNVAEPEFVAALDKLIEAAIAPGAGAAAKDARAYLRFHFVSTHESYLGARFVDEAFQFKKDLLGTAKDLPRWKRCVHAVDGGMGMALAQPFVKAKLGDQGRAETRGMVRAIEDAMRENLARLPWMDDATRARAQEKLGKIANMIGYPDAWRSYEGLTVDRASFASTMMRAAAFEVRRDLRKIGKPVDRSDWSITPPTVNAFYDPSLNQMVFPAGILQLPFFSVGAPRAVSFGGIGMVMGHELTHGFDDEGRKYDGDGNLRDWWSPTVNTEFEARAACVQKQFDGYVVVDDVHENGKLTLGENIADLGGLKMARTAYARAGAGDRGQTRDAAEADRQFFLGFAQAWCSSERDELKRLYVYDVHALPRFRVNGPLSNTPAFASAFRCAAGSPMVRAERDRCDVW